MRPSVVVAAAAHPVVENAQLYKEASACEKDPAIWLVLACFTAATPYPSVRPYGSALYPGGACVQRAVACCAPTTPYVKWKLLTLKKSALLLYIRVYNGIHAEYSSSNGIHAEYSRVQQCTGRIYWYHIICTY